MQPRLNIKFKNKKTGVETITHKYEYDLVNQEGQKFHVSVNRETVRHAPIIKG